jgi:hypothetical protein
VWNYEKIIKQDRNVDQEARYGGCDRKRRANCIKGKIYVRNLNASDRGKDFFSPKIYSGTTPLVPCTWKGCEKAGIV